MQTRLKLVIVLATFPLWIVPAIIAMWIFVVYSFITEKKR